VGSLWQRIFDFILILLAVLLTPTLRFDKGGKVELELEVLTPSAPGYGIPESILEEFTERLEKNPFYPESMEEKIQKIIEF
jgi:hypothetical protein